MPLSVQPQYELPPTIKSIQEGWQTTLSSGATVSALLAAVEAQLFVFVKSSDQEELLRPNSTVGQALLLFTYLTFLCSMSATVSSLLLTDEIGELETRASHQPGSSSLEDCSVTGSKGQEFIPHEYDQATTIRDNTLSIMVRYGLHAWLKLFTLHWALMLALGYISLLCQIVIYVWIAESAFIRFSVLAVTFFMLVPLFSFLVHPLTSHGRTNNYEFRGNAETGGYAEAEKEETLIPFPVPVLASRGAENEETSIPFPVPEIPSPKHLGEGDSALK